MATMKSWNMAVCLLSAGVLSALLAGCASDSQAITPEAIEQQYGVPGAFVGQISTPDGPLKGTVVPVTLADGRKGQLLIPQGKNNSHAAYLQDASGTYPVQVRQTATRQEVVESPAVVDTVQDPQHPNQRSWEKQALIIGGTAGAGAAVGAIAGGGKGAG